MADARRRRLLGAAAALTACALVAGCGSSSEDTGPLVSVQTADNHGYHGTYLDAPYVVPDIALDDTDGKPFSLARSDATLKIVFYGYTNCPDICQIVMSTIASALTRLDDAQRRQVEVAFVTTDPARDTEHVLRTYLDRYDDTFVGLTGPLKTITRLGEPMKVFVEKGKKLPSGGYEVDHSTYTYGVVGDQVRLIWARTTSPAELAADIIKLLKSSKESS